MKMRLVGQFDCDARQLPISVLLYLGQLSWGRGDSSGKKKRELATFFGARQ